MLTFDDIRRLGWIEEYEQFTRDFEALKERIARQQGAERDLRTLKKAGADPRAILEFLVRIVHDLSQGWRGNLKEQQIAYRNAALAIRGSIEAVEKVASNPLCRGEFWLMLLNPGSTVNLHTRHEVQARALEMISQMRAYEEYSLGMANAFGQYSREQSLILRRREIGRLLTYIQKVTSKNFDNEVSRLLTDAHEVVGSKRQFSLDMLKKIRQRHTRA